MATQRDNLPPHSDDAPATAPKPDVDPVPPPPLKTGDQVCRSSADMPKFGEAGTEAEEPPEPLKNGFA